MCSCKRLQGPAPPREGTRLTLPEQVRPERVRERVFPAAAWGVPSLTLCICFSTAFTACCASLTRLCACSSWRCALCISAQQPTQSSAFRHWVHGLVPHSAPHERMQSTIHAARCCKRYSGVRQCVDSSTCCGVAIAQVCLRAGPEDVLLLNLLCTAGKAHCKKRPSMSDCIAGLLPCVHAACNTGRPQEVLKLAFTLYWIKGNPCWVSGTHLSCRQALMLLPHLRFPHQRG